jgi:hypothetical protein
VHFGLANFPVAYCGLKIITSLGFVDLLKNNLPEHRDNRGKRHTLVWVIVGFVLATLVGRQKLSSIHRYICNLSRRVPVDSSVPIAVNQALPSSMIRLAIANVSTLLTLVGMPK